MGDRQRLPRLFGIGRSLAAPPSHTTVHTGHVHGGSADWVNAQSILPVRTNRSVISGRANVGFIPATGLAPYGLAGCSAVVPWQATSPLFQSPLGEPFGPSATRATYYALCRLLPFVRLGSRLAQLAWVNSLAPTARQISRGKTQNCPCISAGFIKHAPWKDGGLRCHVPTRPERVTPQIRFVYLAPHFRIGLPSDLTSR